MVKVSFTSLLILATSLPSATALCNKALFEQCLGLSSLTYLSPASCTAAGITDVTCQGTCDINVATTNGVVNSQVFGTCIDELAANANDVSQAPSCEQVCKSSAQTGSCVTYLEAIKSCIDNAQTGCFLDCSGSDDSLYRGLWTAYRVMTETSSYGPSNDKTICDAIEAATPTTGDPVTPRAPFTITNPDTYPNGLFQGANNAESRANCPTCWENTFVQSSTCTDCPSFTTNAAGDSRTGGDSSCDPNQCTENISGGTLVVTKSDGNNHNSVATFSCQTGYTLSSTDSVTCTAAQPGAAWPAWPTCSGIPCTATTGVNATGTAGACECADGYTGNVTYDSNSITGGCQANSCNPLSVANSNASSLTGVTGDSVLVQCDTNFVSSLTGTSETVSCNADGGWTPSFVCQSACASSPCGANQDCTETGTQFTCSCQQGYDGTAVTDGAATCSPSPCSQNNAVPNSDREIPFTGVTGDKLNVTCNQGFTPTTAQEIECLATGSWTTVTCLQDCPVFTTNNLDTSSVPATAQPHGTSVTFSCNKGYSPSGTVSCDRGSWSPISGTGQCDSIACALNEKVVSNECVSCGTNEWNAAGDLASGQDTMCMCVMGSMLNNSVCEATACGEDEFVSNYTCTECPKDSSNKAGQLTTVGNSLCKGCFAGTWNVKVGIYPAAYGTAVFSTVNESFSLNVYGVGEPVSFSGELKFGDTLDDAIGLWLGNPSNLPSAFDCYLEGKVTLNPQDDIKYNSTCSFTLMPSTECGAESGIPTVLPFVQLLCDGECNCESKCRTEETLDASATVGPSAIALAASAMTARFLMR